MTHTIRIRPAHAADAALIAEWNAAMAMETEGKHLDPQVVHDGVANGIADPAKARYFVAMEDASVAGAETLGIPVGTLMLTTEWSDWRNGHWWWIQSVYVPPEHRRKGVFSALYRHVESLAKAAPDVVGIRLYVEKHNEKAQAAYGRLGLVKTDYEVMQKIWPRE